jgi:broad specificity phosphatase PhoE
MKNVRLVHHGESAANAGSATLDHASIPLTEKGIEQAKRVAQSVGRAPGLIVASPFFRAQATADATISLFPDAPFETWPHRGIHPPRPNQMCEHHHWGTDGMGRPLLGVRRSV